MMFKVYDTVSKRFIDVMINVKGTLIPPEILFVNNQNCITLRVTDKCDCHAQTLIEGDIVEYFREYRDMNGLLTKVKGYYTIEWNKKLAAFTLHSPRDGDAIHGAGLITPPEHLKKIGNRFTDPDMYKDICSKIRQEEQQYESEPQLSPTEQAKLIISLAKSKGIDLEKIIKGEE
ncbi:MAG: hypothetical protein ABIJ40_00725 [Bacteroidota bacterium]